MLALAGSAQGLSRQINCLAVHPSRPHLCVTGASSGTLAVWDLRMTSAPAVQSAARPGAGEVLEASHHSCHGYNRCTRSDGISQPYSQSFLSFLSVRSNTCVLLEPSTLLAV